MNNTLPVPLVSVVCTTYNHQNYIEETLKGFLIQQTEYPIEIIVHDDASTDNTADIIRKYEENHPHLFCNIYQSENQYSKGVDIWGSLFANKCRGKYIAICEGDDFWTDPLKLQKQVAFLEENNDYGLIYTDVDFFYQQSRCVKKMLFGSKTLVPYIDFENMLVNKGYIAPCTWLMRKDLLRQYSDIYCDKTFVIALDFMLYTKVMFLPEVTATYRVLAESASHTSSVNKRYLREKNLYHIQNEFIRKANVKNLIRIVVEERFYRMIFPLAVAVDDKDMIRSVWLALKQKTIKDRLLYLIAKMHLGCILKYLYSAKYSSRR